MFQMMTFVSKPSWCRLAAVIVALCLMSAAPALAEQRLVRVIWDVGTGSVLYRAEPRVKVGQDGFVVPPNAAEARLIGFVQAGPHSLHEGDVVRLYIVNYNPVSHVWDQDAISAEQIAKQPSVVGPLLNAAILALTGAGTLPAASVTQAQVKLFSRSSPPPGCGDVGDVSTSLDRLQDAVKEAYGAATAVASAASDAHLPQLAKRLADLPSNTSLSRVFDDREAWGRILNDSTIFGVNFEVQTARLATEAAKLQDQVDAANKALLDFDQKLVALPRTLSALCETEAKRLLDHRNNASAFIKELVGADSPLSATLASFDAANTLWAGYQRSLTNSTWTDEAIEMIVKDPLAADSVVRIDGVFASPDKTVTAKAQRSLVLGMATSFPVLAISSGVGYNRFNFQTLTVSKVTSKQADGTTVAKDQFALTDDTTWNPIVPVWLENIRIVGLGNVGLYGTFGTTPDRNIFNNAILGGSVVVPRWRTVFTVAMIAARGYTTEELNPVIAQFSDTNGFVLDGVTKDNVSLPAMKWHKSVFVSVSFILASF